MKKFSLFVLCALLCLMNGCGSKEDKNISDLSGKEKLIIGMDCENQPFAFGTATQNEDSVVLGDAYCKGFDVSLARYITSNLQREIEIVNIDQNKMTEALAEGSIDVAISALTWSDSEDIDVSSPYYEEEHAIVVLKDSKLAKAKAISEFAKAKMMGVAQSASNLAIDEIKDVQHLEAATDIKALQEALSNKTCDALVVSLSQAKAIIKNNKDFVMLTFKDAFKTKNQYVIAMEDGLKDEEESLYHEIEKVLSKLEEQTKTDWMKKFQ